MTKFKKGKGKGTLFVLKKEKPNCRWLSENAQDCKCRRCVVARQLGGKPK